MLIQPQSFTAGTHSPHASALADWYFLFQDGRLLLVAEGDLHRPPTRREVSASQLVLSSQGYMGTLSLENGQRACFFGEVGAEVPLPGNARAYGLRSLFGRIDDTLLALAGRAQQLLFWETTHRFCGRCGTPTELAAEELARRCPACGLSRYANPAPAIIIAVTRTAAEGRELLLVRNHRFPPERFSVIAGFVEPGESLEDCCRREVMEEVGVAIDNIRYFASQAWPFPNSLMVGFTANYAGGDFALEEAEIAEAGWYRADAMPSVPPAASIARALIDDFVTSQLEEPAPLRDWT
jgi:NAD+ diphosphatase